MKTKLTEKEQDAFEALALVAQQVLALPLLHSSERSEAEHEIHIIQMRLLGNCEL